MMRFLRFSGLAILVSTILSVGIPRQARGQEVGTPTATPSPTATPTIPPGSDLLTKMRAVANAKNTVHVDVTSDIEVPSSLRVVSTFAEDVSIRPQLVHVVGKIATTRFLPAPARTTTKREQVVVVKSREALKLGKKAWTCSTVGSPPLTTDTTSVTNVGAEILGSVPVWHVRENASVVVGSATVVDSQTVPVTADFYISQADFTLVRAATSDSYTNQGITANATVVQHYSAYGETVHIKMPTACKGKQTVVDALQPPLLSESFPQFAGVWRRAG